MYIESITYVNIIGIKIIAQKVGEGGNVAIWESSFYISLELTQYKSETHLINYIL